MTRMIADTTFLFDEIRDAPGGPQAGVIPQRFRPTLQATLDPCQVVLREARLATGAAGVLQPGAPRRGQLPDPAIHRLAMHAESAGDFCFGEAVLQQPRRLKSAALKGGEITSHTGGVSHTRSIADVRGFVTIFYET